jgi:hypothetical protein
MPLLEFFSNKTPHTHTDFNVVYLCTEQWAYTRLEKTIGG